jgi:hypothetical protein
MTLEALAVSTGVVALGEIGDLDPDRGRLHC